MQSFGYELNNSKRRGKSGGGGGGGGGVIGLKFDTATATAGVTFSNSDTTANNNTALGIASAKASSQTVPLVTNNWYFEFTIGSSIAMSIGVGLPSFICNTTNRVGFVANSVGYLPQSGYVYGSGTFLGGFSSATTGDVIGFKLQVYNPGSLLTIIKNGVEIASSLDTSAYITSADTAWVPIWSSTSVGAIATISNNVYSYTGFTTIGTVTTIAASASVTPTADGKYDVYTFNASGTFTTTTTGAVRALVIAGGGGASGRGGAGGAGAGGYQEKGVVTTPQTYTITVGAGGSSLLVGNPSSFGSVLASTGGGSGSYNSTKNGGSGGGQFSYTGGADAVGTGIVGQGFSGGNASFTGTVDDFASAGGGGAGGVGSNSTEFVGGNGGPGVTSSITGTAVARGGGGAGTSSYTNGTATAGGGTFSAAAGTANTGGGAGSGTGGTGGSGVVIIRVRARA